MKQSRREFLETAALTAGAAAALPAQVARAQGISSRNIRAATRGKPSGLPFAAQFQDVAAEAGLREIVVYGGLTKKDFIIETVGCGVALFDFDRDGWLDIFLLSGTRTGEQPPNATNRLYRNNRDGTFTDVTEHSGLRRTGWASAVTVGDYDNDGWEDIFVTYYGQNVLYHNNGDGTFTDVTAKSGLLVAGEPRWSSGCTFLDFDRDGHLDLFVAHYVDLHMDRLPKPGANPFCNYKGVPVNCGPRGLPMPRNTLYRNQGDGTFRDVSAAAGIDKVERTYSMTAVAADFTRSGFTDLYIASDSTPSLFLRNRGDGTFIDEGAERGVAFSADGAEQAGMGIAVGDYNLDGRLDIFKTHFSDDTSVLYRNQGDGNFADVTIAAGIAVETRYISWGAGFADFDNNGWPDLAIVTGSVYPEVEAKFSEYPLKTPRVLYRNLGDGRFEELITEAGPGIAAPHCSRGCAFGDFDNDGDVDMVIVNLNEPPSLLRNDGAGKGHWLKVFLVGTISNRSAIGSTVLVSYGGHTQAQAVTAQSSFYSVNDRRLHFGLGANEKADVEIRWTNGLVERYPSVGINLLLTAREGHGITTTALPQLPGATELHR